jgi:hypothetical protein
MSKKLNSLAADGLKWLSNRKLEIVAQQLAKGATAAEASIADGYRTNGAAFAANCRQRANYPEVKSRGRPIRQRRRPQKTGVPLYPGVTLPEPNVSKSSAAARIPNGRLWNGRCVLRRASVIRWI